MLDFGGKMKSQKVLFSVSYFILTFVVLTALSACAKEPAPTTPALTTPAVTTPASAKPTDTVPTPTKPAPAPTAPAASVYKWKYQTMYAANNWLGVPLSTKLCELIVKNSDGRIQIESYYAPQLFPADQSMEAMHAGVIQLGLWAYGYDEGKVAMLGLIDTPLTFVTWEDFVFLNNNLGITDLISKAYEPYGCVAFAYGGGPKSILTRKPIERLADIKGLKIRAQGFYMDWLNALGASSVYLPMNEIYTSLATNIVDAVHLTFGSHKGIKVYEQTKYYTPFVGWGMFHHDVAKKALDQLPNDLKKIVLLSGQEYSLWGTNTGMLTELYGGPVETFKKAGLTECNFPASEWAGLEGRAVWEQLMNKKAGKDPLALEFIATLKKYYDAKAAGTLLNLVNPK